MSNKTKKNYWTPFIMVALAIILIITILFGWNLTNESSNNNYKYDNNDARNNTLISDEKTITISGVDNSQEISNDVPIKLVISGVRNTITIKENTQVTEIIVSGTDIIIYLPEGNNPKITDNGIRTKISYY